MTDQVLEWAPFRLKAGVDEATLLEASERLQREFLARQYGFVRRELIKGAEGFYVDLVWWDSLAASQAAMKKAAVSTACKAYFAVMDCDHGDPGDGVLLYHVVAVMERCRARALPVA